MNAPDSIAEMAARPETRYADLLPEVQTLMGYDAQVSSSSSAERDRTFVFRVSLIVKPPPT